MARQRRELRNLIERALILGAGPSLEIGLPSDVPSDAREEASAEMTLEENERRHIVRALKMTQGRIRGKGGAAERLGLHEATLRSRMKALRIARQQP